MGHSFDTLRIQVTDSGTSAPFRVQVTTGNGQTQSSRLQLDGLAPVPPPGGQQSLQSYGHELFARLFTPPVDQVFVRALNAAARNDRTLRVLLWLDSQDPALHDIPWELLYYHAGGDESPLPLAASPQITFARYIGTDQQPFTPISTRPLSLTLLVAAPKDLGTDGAWHHLLPINREFEHEQLTASLGLATNAHQITIATPVPVTEETLHRALHGGTNVLVFFGHALHHPQYGTRLVLEEPTTNEAVLYHGDELVAQLRQLAPTQRPALIVLTACNTATVQRGTPTTPDPLQPSAPALLAAQLVNAGGVPAVLAMQRLVDIGLARTFTATLNEQLLRHGSLDLAVRNARQRIFQHDDPAWGIPVLYMRMNDGQLFTPNVHLEYLQLLREDEQLVRWQRDEYIHMHALAVPPERSWHLLHTNPHDAPAGRDVIETLRHTLLHDQTAQPHPVFFVGKPRSGQTTSMLRLTSDLVETALQQDDYRRSIPVYVPLDTYQHQYGSNRLAETIIQAASSVTPAIRPELEQLLLREREHPTTTRYIWLLDGFESIPEGLRTEAVGAIQQLAKRLPTHRVLVSTVDEAFRAVAVSSTSARVVLLQPLNDRLIEQYVTQRYGEQARVLMRRLQEARLMELATDPSLLRMITERLMQDSTTAFTEVRLLQSILDLLLSNVTLPDIPGDVVNQTLNTLAWEYRWRQVTSMSLHELFALMHAVRQGRDYNLETLFRVYRDAGIFSTISPQRVTFAFPAIQSYCAARALLDRPDSTARLHDILSMCGVSDRFRWWEGTLAAVVALLDTPAPIQHLADVAVLEQSSNYVVLLARLLQSLSERAKRNLTDQQRMMLLDTCAMYLRPDREPIAARRAQIATALGNLNFPRVLEELHRALVTRLRPTASGMQYDVDLVRIALARAIHRALVQSVNHLPYPLTPATLTIAATLHPAATPNGTNEANSANSANEASTTLQLALRRLGPSEPSILAVFTAWLHCTLGTAEAEQQGRAHLRAVLLAPGNDRPPLARALAAFALGDMARKTADADLMFAMIVRPPAFGVDRHDWNDAVWAAASALNLFDPRLTARKLHDYLHQYPDPTHNVAQLAYLAGQSRANDTEIRAWLVHLVVNHAAFDIKASALTALARAGQTTSTPSAILSELPERDDIHDVADERTPPFAREHTPPFARERTPLFARERTPPIRRLIEAIADWDETALDNMTTTFVQNPLPPAADITRLRRIALEALALIGDKATLETLDPRADRWTLELRSAWHLTSRAIRARIRLAGQDAAIL